MSSMDFNSFEELKKELDSIDFSFEDSYNKHIQHSMHFRKHYFNKKQNFCNSIPKDLVFIYLDLNIWIHFRDILLNKSKDIIWNKIYKISKELVNKKKVSFLISTPLYLELEKQEDNNLRLSIIQLMHELSMGITIEYPFDLIYNEILFCLFDILKKDYPNPQFQYNKSNFILGLPLIENKNNLKEFNALNNLLIDLFYHMTFDYYYKNFLNKHKNEDSLTKRYKKLSEKLNVDLTSKDGVRNNDFNQVLLDEFGGQINASRTFINNAIYDFYKYFYPEAKETQQEIDSSNFINMFYNLKKYNKLNNYLPTLQINAELHTIFRTSKNRKFSQNHLFDFKHGAIAIPYCDYFFTDGPFATMLKNKPLNYSKRFNTIIENEPNIILDMLNELL